MESSPALDDEDSMELMSAGTNDAVEEDEADEDDGEECQPFIDDLQPENVHMLRGSELVLTAKFSGNPLPKVDWYHGGDLLLPGDCNTVLVC